MSRTLWGARLGALGLLTFLLLVTLAPLAGVAHADAVSYPPLKGAITGPNTVGEQMTVNYTLSATGGPAVAANGTVVGSYTYKANYSAINETGIRLGPATQGVLVNGSITLEFEAPNVTEIVTISVVFNSTDATQSQNATTVASMEIQIVQPFVLSATLVVGSGASVQTFALTVLLDGTPVGQITIPTLTAGSSRGIAFRYVDTNLAPGWHTFTISLANQHGLVTFAGGSQTLDETFYVQPAPPDNSVWYLAGAVAFFGAIFIWSMRVGARRRGKARK